MIKHSIIEKEERRRSELLSRELHELQECTFQPQLSTGTGSRGEHYSFSHNRSVHKSMNSSFADANGVQVSLSLRFKGLFLYTGCVLRNVEYCIR